MYNKNNNNNKVIIGSFSYKIMIKMNNVLISMVTVTSDVFKNLTILPKATHDNDIIVYLRNSKAMTSLSDVADAVRSPQPLSHTHNDAAGFK